MLELLPIILLYFIFAGFAFCGSLLLMGIMGFIIAYIIRNTPDKSGRDDRRPWAVIAKANNLKFSPGIFGYFGNRITGEYKGYDLILEFIPRENTRTTKLLICEKDATTRKSPATYEFILHEPISFDDITNLLAPNGLPDGLKGTIYALNDGEAICYKQSGQETDIEYLQTIFDLVSDIADAYPKILSIGGEAAPILEKIAKSNDPLQSVARSLLESIGKETTKRLSSTSTHLLCSRCFARFSLHKVRFFWRSVSYYGCRNCGQSDIYIDFTGPIVAVLDTKQDLKQWEQDGKLWINWLQHRNVFDSGTNHYLW